MHRCLLIFYYIDVHVSLDVLTYFFYPAKDLINNVTIAGIISNNVEASGIREETRVSAINGQWAEKKLLKYLTAQRTRSEHRGLAKALARRKHPSRRREGSG